MGGGGMGPEEFLISRLGVGQLQLYRPGSS